MSYYDTVARTRRVEADTHKGTLLRTLPEGPANLLDSIVKGMSLDQVRLLCIWIQYEALAQSTEHYAEQRQ